MNNIDKLLEETSTDSIILVEGYECTGKTYLLNKLSVELYLKKILCLSYSADYNILSDKVLKRGNRFIIGTVATDVITKIRSQLSIPIKLLLDRWFISSLAYKEYYDQSSDFNSNDDLLNLIRGVINNENCVVLYKQHKIADDAKDLLSRSVSDGNHRDKYDITNWSVYLDYYMKFNDMFINYLQLSSSFIKVIPVRSTTNEILDHLITSEEFKESIKQ